MRFRDRLFILLGIFLIVSGSTLFAEEKQDAAKQEAVLKKPSPVTPSQNVEKIQKQLEDVVRVNQLLQEDYLKRMEKMRQVSEQARIHQKILDGIRNQTPEEASIVQKAIRQEKIRLIAEQARKNQELLNSLRSERGNAG